jgi:hypothetical protein
MATRGTPLTFALQQQVIRYAHEKGIRAASKALGVARATIRKYVRAEGQRSQPVGGGR